ncbi:HAD family hydrolase [Veillonella criceti]|uniref:Bifunctional phosphatase/peptidyl-prolyl cis-trans isomerase n=1 Tax=Veillonella criceti TaxID=103891 RepID=A0A380NLP4_9FIRM|nr:HAD-IIB family hydrolase [Veillonella criceti]SUP44118.1 Putative bifunctional phosphatase/peptidyl-prolyl cis-trans isomerase [Veillonella criceti]
MKKKFFFFDIDNTLAVWPDGIIPASAQETLDTLKANGHRVALATGRLQKDAKRFADLANVTDFVADGGKSVTINNEIIFMEGMDREACVRYITHLEERGLHWAVTDVNELVRVTPYETVLQWHPDWDVFKTVYDPTFDYRQVEHFYKIYAFMTPEQEERKQVVHMTTDLIRYGENCILFEPMVKAEGVRRMIAHYGMKPEDVVVFGDGYNDLSMFSPEWLNIAMGNGREELKAAADYITSDCKRDGIYEACKNFGWI